MNNIENIARILIMVGIIIFVIGIILFLFSKIGSAGLRLPGDIYIKKGNFTFYFPVVTCIIISIILSFIFNIFSRK